MSFGHKAIEEIEVDDMKVKSHLDTSFEESGLCVSEELLRKTMDAIDKQSSTHTIEDDKNVVFLGKTNQRSRYIRRYAGVAAAVVLMIAGYQMVTNMGYIGIKSSKSDKKSFDTSENSNEYEADSTSKELDDTADTSYGLAERSTELDVSFAASSNNNEEDSGVADTDGSVTEEVAPELSNASESPQIGITFDANNSSEKMSFNQISILAPDEVQYLRITSVTNESSITFTEPTKIEAFYDEMTKYSFNASTKSSTNWYYIIELKKEEEAIAGYYTVWIGDSIMVQYTEDEEESYSSYDAVNQEELIVGLNTFFD